MLIAADALMVVAGLIAAGRLVGVLGLPSRIGDDLVLGPSPTPSSGGRAAAEGGTSARAEALTNAAPRRTNLNVPMISVGFAGGVLLMLSSLEIPYTGGYLDLRILPLGTSLFGVLAAAAAPLVAGIAVVVAAALPRAAAIALMVGTAVAAAVPSLTAAVAVLAGAPTALSAGAWWGLLGAVVLALSGLLARRSPRRVQDDDRPVVRSTGLPSVAVGILALAGAGLALAAARMPLLLMDARRSGGRDRAEPRAEPMAVHSSGRAAARRRRTGAGFADPAPRLVRGCRRLGGSRVRARDGVRGPRVAVVEQRAESPDRRGAPGECAARIYGRSRSLAGRARRGVRRRGRRPGRRRAPPGCRRVAAGRGGRVGVRIASATAVDRRRPHDARRRCAVTAGLLLRAKRVRHLVVRRRTGHVGRVGGRPRDRRRPLDRRWRAATGRSPPRFRPPPRPWPCSR